jgi:hypothetical protein
VKESKKERALKKMKKPYWLGGKIQALPRRPRLPGEYLTTSWQAVGRRTCVAWSTFGRSHSAEWNTAQLLRSR